MRLVYARSENWMDEQLRRLTQLVPRPKEALKAGPVAFNFVEKSPQQAIVLKLARTVSGLRAANTLLGHGFLQEQAALCRMVNEFQEDVTFLALASIDEGDPPILEKYLDAFFARELSADQFRAGDRVKGRAVIRRKDILNYVAGRSGLDSDPFRQSNAGLAISFAFSGYVHGAAEHTMEMYDPQSCEFVTLPDHHDSLRRAHEEDIWNYYYRGILAFGYAALAFDDGRVRKDYLEFRSLFESRSGDRMNL